MTIKERGSHAELVSASKYIDPEINSG